MPSVLSASFLMPVSKAVSGTIPLMKQHFSNSSRHPAYLVFPFLIGSIVLVSFFVLKRLDGIIAEDGKEVEEDTSIELSINGDIIQRRFSSAISLLVASHMVEYGIGSAVEATRILGSLTARSTVKDPGLLIVRAGVCYMRLALYDDFVVKKGKLTA